MIVSSLYECHNHTKLKVNFYVNGNGILTIKMISSEDYRADTFLSGICPTFYLSPVGDKVLPENRGKRICSLSRDPHITPDNFDEKIKTLLVFS